MVGAVLFLIYIGFGRGLRHVFWGAIYYYINNYIGYWIQLYWLTTRVGYILRICQVTKMSH